MKLLRCALPQLRNRSWSTFPRYMSSKPLEQSPQPPSQKVPFGLKDVDRNEKRHMVDSVFDSVADRYDLMNDLMSVGIHRIWKNEFVGLIDPVITSHNESGAQPLTILDIAGGTGDIAMRIHDKVAKAKSSLKGNTATKIVVVDPNAEMLRVGQKRAEAANKRDIQWVCATGEDLPFEDNSVDIVTIAFGIRNFTSISEGLRSFHRVLKPGGRVICLEFSKVENPCLASAYKFYNFNVIPLIGKLITSDKDSYRYLAESIDRFPDPKTFCDLISKAGFGNISYMKLSAGITAIHSCYKL